MYAASAEDTKPHGFSRLAGLCSYFELTGRLGSYRTARGYCVFGVGTLKQGPFRSSQVRKFKLKINKGPCFQLKAFGPRDFSLSVEVRQGTRGVLCHVPVAGGIHHGIIFMGHRAYI